MFLCCGDSLFDVFAGGSGPDDGSSVDLNARIGGSPLNVALGLARLGHRSAFLAKVSDDLFGRRIRAFMAREGIVEDFVVPTRRKTTLAMISLSSEGSPLYDFYIEGTADRSLEVVELPASLPDDLAAIHIGSYATVTEPTASALTALVAREGTRRLISYDPNVRLGIEPDLDVWRSRVASLVPGAGLVKASEEDLAVLYPGRALETVLADWTAAGASLAVATRGERGALALARSGVRASVPGLVVDVIDTVGAGDTFQASLLARLFEDRRLSREAIETLDGAELEDVLAFAVRAAALTCTRRGADLPRRADLGLDPLPV